MSTFARFGAIREVDILLFKTAGLSPTSLAVVSVPTGSALNQPQRTRSAENEHGIWSARTCPRFEGGDMSPQSKNWLASALAPPFCESCAFLRQKISQFNLRGSRRRRVCCWTGHSGTTSPGSGD